MGRKNMMEYICVLTMLVIVLTGKFAQCFEYEVSLDERLTFGEMTTFMQTDSHVYHMDADEYIPGNILFSDLHSLKTTDSNTLSTITGSPTSSGYQNGIGVQAKFSVITGFLQVSLNEVIIVDYMNHCIRWLDRRNASVSDFAGECGESGYVDGMGTTARFQNPTSAIRDARNTNQVIISDRYNNALRVLDVKTASVSTLLKDDSLKFPRAFTYDPTNEDALIITQNFGVQRLFISVVSREDISGGSLPDFKDGSLRDARYRFCRQIFPLHDQIYILIDYGNHRLRILDLLNDTVSSICTGTTDHLDGPVSECQLKNPSSLLLIGHNLYIGTLTRIRLLPVSLENIKVTNTTTKATMPTTPAINSPLDPAILNSTKTSTAMKSTAFQPTKASDIGGGPTPRKTTPLESAAGLPAAEPLQVKTNTLVIGLSISLSGLLICAVAAFAIRRRKIECVCAQSTSYVCTLPPPSPYVPLPVPERIYENSGIQNQPIPSAPILTLLSYAPQQDPIYENSDVPIQARPSAPTLDHLR